MSKFDELKFLSIDCYVATDGSEIKSKTHYFLAPLDDEQRAICGNSIPNMHHKVLNRNLGTAFKLAHGKALDLGDRYDDSDADFPLCDGCREKIVKKINELPESERP